MPCKIFRIRAETTLDMIDMKWYSPLAIQLLLASVALASFCSGCKAVNRQPAATNTGIAVPEPVADTRAPCENSGITVVRRSSVASDGVIGKVCYAGGILTLDKGTDDGFTSCQQVFLCVREKKSLIRIGTAEAMPSATTSTLKLNIRNVADEDGDLIVQEFKAAPKRYLETHEVVAVACEESSVDKTGKGELKAK